MIVIFERIILTLMALSLIYTSYTDMRYRLIKNQAVGVVFILSLCLAFSGHYHFNYIAPLAILGIGFLLHVVGFMGAGDIKLLVALSVALTHEQVIQMLMVTAIAGIPVAIIAFIVYKIRKNKPRCEVPYGVAIAIGYLLTLMAIQ